MNSSAPHPPSLPFVLGLLSVLLTASSAVFGVAQTETKSPPHARANAGSPQTARSTGTGTGSANSAKEGASNPVGSNQVYGRILAAVGKEPDDNGESPVGDLLADAQLMATQPAALGRADIALVNPQSWGRAELTANYYPHDVRFAELKALQPNGLTLITLSLTAQQLKYVLEQQFAGCGGQTAQRILQVSNGFSFSWKSNRGTCAKVWDIKLIHMDLAKVPPTPSGVGDVIASGGVMLNPEKTYRVTVDEEMAKGKFGFSILKDGMNPTEGVNDIDAIAAYLEKFKFPKASYDPNSPTLNRPRIVRLPLP